MPPFDPGAIPPFTAIRLPFQFSTASNITSKWFVILKHDGAYAECLKVTSKVDRYKANPLWLAGCAAYAPGEVSCFPKETLVQTDNGFRIPHDDIEAAYASGQLTIGEILSDCRARLLIAIPRSHRLTGSEKRKLMEWIS